MKKILIIHLGIAMYLGSILANRAIHDSNFYWAGGEALNAIRLSKHESSKIFINYMGRCLKESKINNPWLYVPGSFLWREPPHPPSLEDSI